MHIFQVTDCGTVTALVSETQPVKSGTLSLQLSESTPVLTPFSLCLRLGFCWPLRTIKLYLLTYLLAFSALTLLVGCQE